MKLTKPALVKWSLLCSAVCLAQPGWAAVNSKPVAVLSGGSGQAGYYLVAQNYQFDATKSYDPERDRLSYQWSLRDSNNQPVALSNARSSVLRLNLSQPGQYSLTLQVSDGKLSSQPVTVPLQVLATAPLQADAGLPLQVKTGQLVWPSAVLSQLRQSTLSQISWQLMQAPPLSRAVVRDADQLQASLVPDQSGDYRLRLLLTDQQQRTSSAELLLSARDAQQNSAPQARVSLAANEVAVAQQLTLSAAASSDADAGDTLSYAWRVLQKPAGSAVSLSPPTLAQTGFAATQPGRYLLELQVTDSRGASALTQQEVLVSSGNLAPISRFVLPARPQLLQLQVLDGSASSDAELQPLQYQWQLLAKPAQSQAVLTDADLSRATITPDQPGQYWLRLTVSDGQRSHVSQQLLTVPTPLPLHISGPQQGLTGQSIRLTAHSDVAVGLNYQWTLLSAPASATQWHAAGNMLEFSAAAPGLYRLAVSLTDAQGVLQQLTHDVLLTTDLPPQIELNGPLVQDGQVGTLFQPDASASHDPEQGPLQFAWQLQKPAGSSAVLSSADTATPLLQPDVAGQYLLTLTATDSAGQQASVTVTLNVQAPVVLIQGDVKGQLLDIDAKPWTTQARLMVNDQQVSVDAQGRFSQQVQLQSGQSARLTLNVPGLPLLHYQSQAQTTDGFLLQFPAQRLPALQKIQLNLYQGCAFYNGPAALELEFSLQQLTGSVFGAELHQQVTVPVNGFEPTTLELPADAVYQVRVKQTGLLLDHNSGSGKFEAVQRFEHQYLGAEQALHAFTVCQKR